MGEMKFDGVVDPKEVFVNAQYRQLIEETLQAMKAKKGLLGRISTTAATKEEAAKDQRRTKRGLGITQVAKFRSLAV